MARTLGLQNVFSCKYKSLNIPTILHSRHTKAEREVLVDSGATEIVPKHYHKWKKVFSEEEAKRYPQHQPWDIAIDLVKDAPKVLDCKIYPLTLAEQGRLEDYIRENLEKGYIRPSHSQYSSPFFFVGKKDGKF